MEGSSMDILKRIEQAGFIVDAGDVEMLARERQSIIETGGRTDLTYTRILVAMTANKIGGKTAHLARRRGKNALGLREEEVRDHLAVFEDVNTMCYEAVSKVVITPDIKEDVTAILTDEEKTSRALERNRRTGYARSAASTVRAFIQAGRDVRDLEVKKVTKYGIRAETARFVVKPESLEANRLQRAALRATARIVEEAAQLAVIDKPRSEALLESLISNLEATLEKLRAGELSPSGDFGTTTVIQRAVQATSKAA
jgi:hypothetical protein